MKINSWKIKEKVGKFIYKCINNRGEQRIFDIVTMINMKKHKGDK